MKKKSVYTTLYSDESIVVLNKASGILIAQDRYDAEATRLDSEAEKEFGKLFAVHRIDKETSGAVIYARTADAHRTLSMAFESREVKKTYHALVYGRPQYDEWTANEKLLPDGDLRHRTIVSRAGKPSETAFRLLGSCSQFSWVEACPKTGRTHQIRAHLLASGQSIVCDSLYGPNQKPFKLSEVKRSWRGDAFEERPLLSRLALHAYKLELLHPQTGEQKVFVAPYPKDLESVRKQLNKIFSIDPLREDL